MWRQLSVLWGLQTVLVSPDALAGDMAFAAYSAVISLERPGDVAALSSASSSAHMIVFLHRIDVDPSTWSISKPQAPPACNADGHYTRFRLELNAASELASGLPTTVVTYGEKPNFVPLTTAASKGRSLVTLDGQPVVVESGGHLLVGADPWQLGSPTNPYVYPIIRSWLEKVVGVRTRGLAPLAAIRLDDLPTTAPELLRHRSRSGIRRLDEERSRLLRRLRLFAAREHVVLNLMYSTHALSNGHLQPLAELMPKSVSEIRAGIKTGAFEPGSHGMVHLNLHAPHVSEQESDHREFVDLTESETENHIGASLAEIERTFQVRPASFVAPNWAYRSAITKTVAARYFSVVIDSSQHVEAGTCSHLGGDDAETGGCSIVETFRPGASVVNFSNPDFWKCFAVAGIPVHYMQHHEKTRDTLRHALLRSGPTSEGADRAHRLGFLRVGANSRTRGLRVASLVLLAIGHATNSQMTGFLVRASKCNMYSVVSALLSAGYRCVALDRFRSELGGLRQ
jgi:hypothetical protein